MAQKFICNGMLGKLCKLLRICGIDTLYSNRGIAILIEARKEGRIILTRNTRLRGSEGVFFLETSSSNLQMKNVIDRYALQDEIQLFSRCLECNEKLTPVKKESVRDKVPYFTYKHFDKFTICPNCQKVYWKGSHYKKMVKTIKDALRGTNDKKQGIR